MPANTQHPVVKDSQPSDEDNLWRYLSLPALIDLLETSTLHFARADTLGDPFEGRMTFLDEIRTSQDLKDKERWRDDYKRCLESWKSRVFINCWRVDELESVAMWKQYGTHMGSVAILTTYGTLVESLPQRSMVGSVQYLDYRGTEEKDSLRDKSMLDAFMSKRKQFEYEKEVRAIICDQHADECGIKVVVHVKEIVQAIIVQPDASPWIREAIKKLLDRYDMGQKVRSSVLDIDDLWF